jgi:hypothetical protein
MTHDETPQRDMQRRAEVVLAASRRRPPAWQVGLRLMLALALYAGLVATTYRVTHAWWGILVGLALPWLALVGYAAVSHAIHQRRAAQDARDRREIGVLLVDLDVPTQTVRYTWNGPAALVPAIALTQLENKVSYYRGTPWRDQLLSRARDLASARLAGSSVPPSWRAIAGEAHTRACDLADIRGKFRYAGHSWIGPGKPMPDDDVDAVLALLHHGLTEGGGDALARSILEIAHPDERVGRRHARFHAAVAPLVAERA